MWRKDMRHSPAFTMWLYLAEDQHPGALIAKSLWIPVDPEPEPELSAKIDTEEKGNDDEREHSTSTH
jgi:hypothetical protein